MKINVKIVLFEKVQAMIVVLFIAVIIISFFLLFGINYYNLSDFMKIGIFLFIICASIISLLLIIDIFTKKIEFYTIELDKLKNYDTNKQYATYLYSDIQDYPEVDIFKIAGFSRYNTITITDKFLDTGINIVNIIKTYIPEANDKSLSNVLSYININYKKRVNKDAGIKRGKMQLKFENQDTVLFLAVYQLYGYGDIERTYEMQQVYEIITNNNELLHAIKELKLSSIFLYEVPLPWDPDYVEIKDEESDELYKLKYQTIEELFCELDKAGYERWKAYVLNFFNEFDKLSSEKAKEFLKLTDYEVPEEWYDILMNKKYLKYIEKYK